MSAGIGEMSYSVRESIVGALVQIAQLLGLLQNGDIVAAAQVCSLGKNGGEVGILAVQQGDLLLCAGDLVACSSRMPHTRSKPMEKPTAGTCWPMNLPTMLS